MQNKKYYIIYKTTNTINGMIYIGQHSTDNLDDGYLGSGTNIKRSVKKYGKDSFIKEILHVYDNFDDMNNKEMELVTEDFIKRSDVYNIMVGGSSELNHPTRGLKSVYKDGKHIFIKESQIPTYLEDGWVLGQGGANIGTPNQNKRGRIAINKNGKTKYISPNVLQVYIGKGWVEGCVHSSKGCSGKISIHKDGKRKYIDPLLKGVYLLDGWILGEVTKDSNRTKGKKTVNKDGINKFVSISELGSYLENGWEVGRYKKPHVN